jgi:hypothetical protein
VLHYEIAMSRDFSGSWLFLLFNLPAKQSSDRVKVWRQLKRSGAIQLKTSTYVLPDAPAHYERFQLLAKEIVASGGEATLVRVKDIEGVPHEAVMALFNEARAFQYEELLASLRQLIADRKRPKGVSGRFTQQLKALRQRFEEIRAIDYFECSRGEDVQRLLEEAEALQPPERAPETRPRLRREDYQGKTWVTRPRPEIDQVGSAWLIRNFIDAGARFVFAARAELYPDALPYGMAGAALSRQHDLCTFQTLVERFGLRDRVVQRLAEIVHDADLDDDAFHTIEGFGIDQVLKGWAKLGLSDEEILRRGFECFDGLQAHFKRA